LIPIVVKKGDFLSFGIGESVLRTFVPINFVNFVRHIVVSGQNAGSEQSLFGLTSDIATFLSDSDQDISDGFVPENSETQIALQQEAIFESVHSCDVSRPDG
jgi:hypothetical protein